MKNKVKAGIIALCICCSFALAGTLVNADDTNPNPSPRCSGPLCWEFA